MPRAFLRHSLTIGLAAMLVLTSGAHFHPTRRQGLIAIVPPRLPFPDHLVTLTGILEILAAVGLLVPPTLHYSHGRCSRSSS